MNDLEQRLKDLLEADATKAPTVQRAPGELRSKVRRRQVGTTVVGAAAIVAIMAASLAGIRAIGRDAMRPIPADTRQPATFMRTTTVHDFAITSPSDWFVIDQWGWARNETARLREERLAASARCGEIETQPERKDCLRALLMGEPGDGFAAPMVTLSNLDPGLGTDGLESSPCFRPQSPAPTEASMTIGFDQIRYVAELGAGDTQEWPVTLQDSSDEGRPSCGPGTYVHFAANDLPFFAYFTFGDAVSDVDRATVTRAFESMRVGDSLTWFHEPIEGHASPSYVIATGHKRYDGGPWQLEIRPGSDGHGPRLALPLTTTSRLRMVRIPTGRHPAIVTSLRDSHVYGTVTNEAASVEIQRIGGPSTWQAILVPMPPSVSDDRVVFYLDFALPGGVRVVAKDRAGQVVAERDHPGF